MNAVLDASVVIQMLFPERFSDKAAAVFADVGHMGWRVVAPALWPAEVTNTIRRRMRRDRFPLSVAMANLEDFLRLPIMLLGEPDLYRQALRLTDAFSLGGHDAQYVALAQMLGCDLWTDDQRVLRAIAGRLPFVRWLGAYVALDAG